MKRINSPEIDSSAVTMKRFQLGAMSGGFGSGGATASRPEFDGSGTGGASNTIVFFFVLIVAALAYPPPSTKTLKSGGLADSSRRGKTSGGSGGSSRATTCSIPRCTSLILTLAPL
ncbi:hypothetical protein A2U01_0051506 [Trifolium medium]|uniref:Transmembrane protein n=1 Tax=Trifolium medium TaxID=97028 RepID=A0A392R219_9FABA|nr:hypothetical protein [Trifolium medium]